MLSQVEGQKTNSMLGHLPSDPMATHNMLVIGEKTVYLSHLPMFQEKDAPPMPHRYQAILEVELQQQGSNPQNSYMKDRQSHEHIKIYTINPERFILPMLVASEEQGGTLTEFKGSIFRGHLEKGGTRILPNINVNVKQVVYFKKFDSLAKRPTQLEYLLFGKGEELFLAHLIVAPPDFDQVVSVKVTGHTFSDEELAKGIKVVFTSTTNAPGTRLKEKQQAEGAYTLGKAATSNKIQVIVNREFYFEEGELRTPPRFETTAEEKKSSFL